MTTKEGRRKMNYIASTPEGASQLWQNAQDARQRAAEMQFNQLMEAVRLQQQQQQFQQNLAQNYKLSTDANERTALARAMSLDKQEQSLAMRERQIQDAEDKTASAQSAKDYNNLFNQAFDEVQRGKFDKMRYYGKLKNSDMAYLIGMDQDRAQRAAAPAKEFAAEQTAADTLNRGDKFQKTISAPPLPTTVNKWNPLNWFFGNDAGANAIQPSDRALAGRAALVSSLGQYRQQVAPRLVQSPTGAYSPGSPAPVGQIPLWAGMTTVPQANLTPPPTLTPAMGAPTMPTPRAAVAPYKIGGRYAGGLVYIGGDPADQNSWQQSQ